MAEYSRLDRVGDFIQRELGQMIQREMRDPRVGMVMVNEVRVARDLAHAKVFVSFAQKNSAEEAAESLEALNKAAGFLRSLLSKTNTMRTTPKLHFIYDDSVIRGTTLSSLIDAAISADVKKRGEPESDGEA